MLAAEASASVLEFNVNVWPVTTAAGVATGVPYSLTSFFDAIVVLCRFYPFLCFVFVVCSMVSKFTHGELFAKGQSVGLHGTDKGVGSGVTLQF